MSTISLDATRLKLVLEGPEEVRKRIESMSPAERAGLSADWLERVQAATVADPWTHGFSMVERVTESVIGSCGFKGPPTSEGVVEIAYGVASEHQGKGYATEAALALLAYAFSKSLVHVVRAHTLPEPNASTRVLTKCGFRNVGETMDPDDGLVWRWEINGSEIPPGLPETT